MTYSAHPTDPTANKRLKRRILIIVGVVILLVIGLFAFRFATAPKGPPMGGGMGVPAVSENPRTDTVSGKVEAVGTLHADQSINVAPEVDGRIAEIPGAEGQAVKKGDLLLQLDQSIPKADLADAEAGLALAQATYGRTRNLAKSQFATRQSEDEALSGLRQAQARQASAKSRFEKTTIEAPFDGVLGLRAKSVGAYIKAGDTVFTLTSVDPIYVDFRVPELKSARVEVGQKVSVSVPALGTQNVEGEVAAVDPALDEAGRSLAVRAKLPNAEGKLHAGLFAQVTLQYGEPHDVLVVPERAVFLKADGSYVYRAKDGKAELVKVTPGDRRVGEVEITGGLAATDDVITDGQIKIQPGAPVMLLNKPNVPPDQMKKQPEAKPAEKKPEETKPVLPAVVEKPPEQKAPEPAPPSPAAPDVKPGTPSEEKTEILTPPAEEPKVEPAPEADKKTDPLPGYFTPPPEKTRDEKKE